MIGKTNVGRGFGGCLRYCLNPEKLPEILFQNGLFGDNPNDLARQFRIVCEENGKVINSVWHTSLSFAYSDIVNENLMIEVANHFMEKAGFNIDNNQFIIIRHKNREHQHIHIIGNRVGYDGQCVSDSFSKTRTACWSKEIEKEFRLHIAVEYHKKDVKDKIPTFNKAKKILISEINDALKKGVGNYGELIEMLDKKGIHSEILKHSNSGIKYGISFKVNNLAIKGSDLSKKFSYANLNKELKQNQQKKEASTIVDRSLKRQNYNQNIETKIKREQQIKKLNQGLKL